MQVNTLKTKSEADMSAHNFFPRRWWNWTHPRTPRCSPCNQKTPTQTTTSTTSSSETEVRSLLFFSRSLNHLFLLIPLFCCFRYDLTSLNMLSYLSSCILKHSAHMRFNYMCCTCLNVPCVFSLISTLAFLSQYLKVGNCFMFDCKFLEIIQVHKSTMLSLSTQALKLPQNFESKYFRVNEKERTTIDFIVYHQHIGSIGRSHKLDNGTWKERQFKPTLLI